MTAAVQPDAVERAAAAARRDGIVIAPVALAEAIEFRHAWLRPTQQPEETISVSDRAVGSVHLAARLDDSIVGVVSAGPAPCPALDEHDSWQLRGMAVHPAMHGRGIGRLLVEALLAQCGDAGCRLIWAFGRTGVMRFYERMGFRREGREFDDPFTGPHFLIVQILSPSRGKRSAS